MHVRVFPVPNSLSAIKELTLPNVCPSKAISGHQFNILITEEVFTLKGSSKSFTHALFRVELISGIQRKW